MLISIPDLTFSFEKQTKNSEISNVHHRYRHKKQHLCEKTSILARQRRCLEGDPAFELDLVACLIFDTVVSNLLKKFAKTAFQPKEIAENVRKSRQEYFMTKVRRS